MLLLLLALGFLPAQARTEPVSLVGISAVQSGADTIVTVRTSSPVVPTPAELLSGPPRLYFDLKGTRPGALRVWDIRLGPVRQIRAALNQARPPVTRVVIDLGEPAAWRVEPGETPGEIRVVLQPQVAIEAAAVDAALAGRRRQIAEDLFAMAPVLELIRGGGGPSDQEMTVALATAERLADGTRAAGNAGSPPDAAVAAAIDAALAALRARAAALADGGAQAAANAISAASGALLLIDHARQLSAARR